MKGNRTKESLIAQQQAYQKERGHKKRGSVFDFSFTKFPPPAVLRVCIVLLIGALLCIALPVFLPDVGKAFYRTKAVENVSKFELSSELFKGQFKSTPHSGTTRPDREATFLAVSILTSPKNSGTARIKHEDHTQQAINQQEAKDFNKNTEEIYQGIVQLKGLGLLKEGSVSKQYTDKYYNLLLTLTERHSAFRLNTLRSASVRATYFAFQAIKELGKMDEFKKLEDFNSAIHFVTSMKDTVSGGFRDTTGENATLLATWYAIQILAEKGPRASELVSKAFEGVDRFIFHCQAKDGGFLDKPLDNLQELYFTHSKMATTSQGLYILEFLLEHKLLAFSFTDVSSAAYYDAINYMRACLSWQHGVLGSYPSEETDLWATYYFLKLVDGFPAVAYGTPRSFQLLSVAMGVVFFLVSLYTFYKPQMPKGAANSMKSEIQKVGLFLALGAVVLQVFPSLALIVYLCFVIHLAIYLYEILCADNTEGLLALVAAVNTLCFVGLVFVLVYLAPLVYANPRVFYVLAAWGAITTLGVTLVSCYQTAIKKLYFYVNAGYLAWICNTIICYAFLYGRGEMAVVYRLMVIHGHFPVIFVVLPLISLIFAYGLSAAAGAYYLQSTSTPGEEPKDKQPTVEEMLQEDEPNAASEGVLDGIED